MSRRTGVWIVVAVVVGLGVAALAASRSSGPSAPRARTSTGATGLNSASTATGTPSGYPGMPPVLDARNIYSEIGPSHVITAFASAPERIYVPNGKSNTLSVIDGATHAVISTQPTGAEPQHVVPSYDLSSLWLLDNQANEVVPIDPTTGLLGTPLPVDDPYNMYFTPDGTSAIVVAEAHDRLDFRDPHTMKLTASLDVPGCDGINHADYSADGSYMIATCEFAGKLAKIDILHRKVIGLLDLGANRVANQPQPMVMRMPNGGSSSYMPQDVRAAPDGHHFYVADMMAGGVFVVDGDRFVTTAFIPTGIGAHGITPSRDGSKFYVANRGANVVDGPPHGPGSVSVIDPSTDTVVATWPIPGGGSPDMGNLNAAGTELWLSGRFDSEVYVFDTVRGGLVARIPVGDGPHGLTVWPQAGRYSLGHTGNER